jgi:hypothetical protein
MELKLLQFEREQLNTETYILKKNRQLYEEAFFWNELAEFIIQDIHSRKPTIY